MVAYSKGGLNRGEEAKSRIYGIYILSQFCSYILSVNKEILSLLYTLISGRGSGGVNSG